MELLTMSNREIDRLRVIRDTIEHKLTWAEAGLQLELGERQIGRLCADVRREGNTGVIHGLRGQPSNRRIAPGVVDEALSIVKARYCDFKPTFANEKLAELHGITISVSALRAAMIHEGLYSPRKHKPKHRAWRPRRACVGELVQLDGSDHDWFEGRAPRCVLLIYIDDATSRILYAEFVSVENTLNLLRATRGYLLVNGRPVAFYVDKDSIYKVNRQANVDEELRDSQAITQFTRAMCELDIAVIAADSPQAKGRVERGFGTHQDRLVKELRLAGISNMAGANEFLREVYVPTHNAKFAVTPDNEHDAHKPLHKTHDLDAILSVRTERVVANDYTIQFQSKFMQLLPEQPVRVRPKERVTIEIRLDGSLHLKCKGAELVFKELPERPYKPYCARRKTVAALPCKAMQYKPPPNHPWRIWRPKPASEKNAPRQLQDC